MAEKDMRYFQWLVGDQQGQVLVFDHIEEDEEEVYIVFKDGSRINENLVVPINEKDATGKMMGEVSSPNNVWTFSEKWVGRTEERWEQNAAGDSVCVQPFVPGRKTVKLIPPKRVNITSNFGVIAPVSTSQIEPQINTTPDKPFSKDIDKTDPVYILMSKSKKTDNDISMTITISLPPKQLYDLAKESFDEGDKKFVEYIIENVTVDDIKSALKDAISSMYEETPIEI